MIPGEIKVSSDDIIINPDRDTKTITVANKGDRPIQVGSHFHFYEVNDALDFPRDEAKGFRLNIPAGTGMRFEPGQEREVELVRYVAPTSIYGFSGKIMGPWSEK